MRAVTSGDIRMLARHLTGVRRRDRPDVALRLLERAHVADRYRKRTGKAHELWGDGSLAAAIPKASLAGAETFVADRDHLEAMSDALAAILCWKDRAARVGISSRRFSAGRVFRRQE